MNVSVYLQDLEFIEDYRASVQCFWSFSLGIMDILLCLAESLEQLQPLLRKLWEHTVVRPAAHDVWLQHILTMAKGKKSS